MQTNVIKNLAIALAIFLGTTAGFSATGGYDSDNDREELRPTHRPRWGINFSAKTGETDGWYQSASARIQLCGSISVDGDNKCIEKKQIVQLLGAMKVVAGTGHRYIDGLVKSLIIDLEKCPCPSVEVEPSKSDCHTSVFENALVVVPSKTL